ncbi:MAG: glucose-1-phosphate cytidylyltransferase [Pseudomonadota bacterium]
MKVVILAGGFGTRLSEETTIRPKPMVEVGGFPMLWHIMKIYSSFGLNDFIICLGYRGDYIKQYFANFALKRSDIVFDLEQNSMQFLHSRAEPWRISCIETGASSMTGGRLRRVRGLLDDTFCFTYGDGVADINVRALVDFHKQHKGLATLTAVQPSGRFGAFQLKAEGTAIERFHEKPKGDGAWVNGGFFVLEPEAIDYIAADETSWEREPLERLSRDGQLHAYKHTGFWQSMDTLRDKQVLSELWESGEAPWRIWEK